ncbi:MAG: hypothetical protein JSV04_01260 [Candidatus Heimdallarchaeota archaeon]|nr:MAG: hypothetical protein JSV04_01260 [Candidatus Heimdallarchaeota archaeon]
MSETAQKAINVVEKVFESKNVEIPLCISIISEDGLELYSTATCDPAEMESINILGLVAFDELKSSFHDRTDQEINILIFRTADRECYVAPVATNIFMVAISTSGKVGNVMPLLDGLSAQVKFELAKLDKEGN